MAANHPAPDTHDFRGASKLSSLEGLSWILFSGHTFTSHIMQLLAALAKASCSWRLLRSIGNLHNVTLTDLDILVQDRWSVTSLKLTMCGDRYGDYDSEYEDEEDGALHLCDNTTAAMWERAFLNISRHEVPIRWME
jgi:hypothetical protein